MVLERPKTKDVSKSRNFMFLSETESVYAYPQVYTPLLKKRAYTCGDAWRTVDFKFEGRLGGASFLLHLGYDFKGVSTDFWVSVLAPAPH